MTSSYDTLRPMIADFCEFSSRKDSELINRSSIFYPFQKNAAIGASPPTNGWLVLFLCSFGSKAQNPFQAEYGVDRIPKKEVDMSTRFELAKKPFLVLRTK